MRHRVLPVVGWCQVLYSGGFLCVSSCYFILPRVSSLVVLGHGISAPSPKAQGLTSSFVWVCIFFSAGQVLLSPVSWCSACSSARLCSLQVNQDSNFPVLKAKGLASVVQSPGSRESAPEETHLRSLIFFWNWCRSWDNGCHVWCHVEK